MKPFSLDTKHNLSEMVIYPKSSFRVTESKRMLTILLYMGKIAIKQPQTPNFTPVSVNSDVIYNFFSELNFGVIYVFIWNKENWKMLT